MPLPDVLANLSLPGIVPPMVLPLGPRQKSRLAPSRQGMRHGMIVMGCPPEAWQSGPRIATPGLLPGASGARRKTTPAHPFRARGKRYGLQALCEGGGIANVTKPEAL